MARPRLRINGSTMPIYRDCPHCSILVRIDEGLIGHRVRCARCRTTFRASQAIDGAKPAREGAARTAQFLEDDNAALRLRQAEADARLAAVLAFDGNWTSPLPHNPPAFRPRGERRAPVIAIANLKGGVGKTTITANLGAWLWSAAPKRRVLLLDLDYQSNLTQSCLDRKTIARLQRQGRLVHTLFAEGPTDPQAVVRCAEPILDDRQRRTDGAVLAGDELLGVAEARSLTRWLVAPDEGDVRFRLRSVLHADVVQNDQDVILLDCPPRLTTTCINALTAADFVLIPVVLDQKSTEGAPRLLRWLRERRATLFPELTGVGVVANKASGKDRDRLVNRERGEWDDLVTGCRDAWQGDVRGFATFVPYFTERAMARKFPACYGGMAPTFAALANELLAQVNGRVEISS